MKQYTPEEIQKVLTEAVVTLIDQHNSLVTRMEIVEKSALMLLESSKMIVAYLKAKQAREDQGMAPSKGALS